MAKEVVLKHVPSIPFQSIDLSVNAVKRFEAVVGFLRLMVDFKPLMPELALSEISGPPASSLCNVQ
jgi:hypothetical protein